MHLYVPALRMKAGELLGLRDLASDIADETLPRLIVPPVGERDDVLQPMLFEGQTLPDIGAALSNHWRGREVLVEPTHLVREFGRDSIEGWLPQMFDRARGAGSRPTLLVQLKELVSGRVNGYEASIDRRSVLQLGVVISSSDVDDHVLLAKALAVFEQIGVGTEQCIVIVDFHDADLTTPSIVSPIIGAALDQLQTIASWGHIVFQGTNFPEKNPAEPNSDHIVPRNEWVAWKQAVTFDPGTAEHLLFGDYAADCSKIVFGGGGGSGAIRHYRYSTPEAWYVPRGSDTGTHEEVMREVCRRILDSGHFAGRDFSSADDFIFLTAQKQAGPGNGTTWRAINTTHHITRVVRDVGHVRGRTFVQRTPQPLIEQIDLFASVSVQR